MHKCINNTPRYKLLIRPLHSFPFDEVLIYNEKSLIPPFMGPADPLTVKFQYLSVGGSLTLDKWFMNGSTCLTSKSSKNFLQSALIK